MTVIGQFLMLHMAEKAWNV